MPDYAQTDPINAIKQLIRQKRIVEAALAADALLQKHPKHTIFLQLRAQIAMTRSNPLLAVDLLKKAVKESPHQPVLRKKLSNAYFAAGFIHKSVEVIEEAKTTFPKAQGILLSEIQALDRLGKSEEAIERIEACKKILENPQILDIKHAELEARTGTPELGRARLEDLLRGNAIEFQFRLSALRALSKICDSLGDYVRSFEAATEANTMQIVKFDATAYVKQTDAIIKYFTAKKIASLPSSGFTSEFPVCICGMPRSGTSLCEQILDCHPQISGAGEREDFFLFTEFLEYESISKNPFCYDRLTDELCKKFGAAYFNTLQQYGFGNLRVTNKPLQLERILGFLPTVIPGMRTIFMRRNPLDSGLSIYLHQLHPARMPWATSLEHIALVQKEHARLVTHWLEVLPTPCMQLSYEDLASEPEGNIKNMVSFLGVAWNDACLAFHENTRPVITPSFDQVNKPMNTHSFDRWKNYEEFLGPLIEAHTP